MIDFERLHRAEPPLTLNTTDLERGEEVRFDTRWDRLDRRHFLATTPFLPDFEAISIGHGAAPDGEALAETGIGPIDARHVAAYLYSID